MSTATACRRSSSTLHRSGFAASAHTCGGSSGGAGGSGGLGIGGLPHWHLESVEFGLRGWTWELWRGSLFESFVLDWFWCVCFGLRFCAGGNVVCEEPW